ELRPGVLDDLGLASAVEWYAERFGARAGLPCRVTVEGADEGVPPEAATAVFRIFQEALTNAERHARATAVEAHLAVTPERLSLRVGDDGVGLAPETLEATRTLGLLGMRERARALGGRVEIESAPGAGTCVSVRVPLPASDGTAGPVPAPPRLSPNGPPPCRARPPQPPPSSPPPTTPPSAVAPPRAPPRLSPNGRPPCRARTPEPSASSSPTTTPSSAAASPRSSARRWTSRWRGRPARATPSSASSARPRPTSSCSTFRCRGSPGST